MKVYYETFGGKDIETANPFKIPLWPKDSRVDHDVMEDQSLHPGRIQQLISSEDYADFEEEIIVEDQFVELDKYGDPIRPVFLALTKTSVLIAVDDLPDIRSSRASVLNGREESESEELELQWFAPLFLVDISMILDEEMLSIKTAVGYKRYFLLSNTRGGGDRDLNWLKWIMNIENANQDIQGYVRKMREKWQIEDIDITESAPNLTRTKSMARSLQRLSSVLTNRSDSVTFRTSEGNSLMVPLDLYDTSGIIHSESSKTNVSCFSCFRHRKKNRKRKEKR
ncbi:hypothetical protein FSP39_005882 [Pinctada imbricata]|uniref:Uncharacterized protein n=1 Tax=Pinctada imbricata TaxID=66713 RepID=A0AA88YHD3_PINIB|nr:hypothetical protein FSP39_005882 [Pinctada imbricata]